MQPSEVGGFESSFVWLQSQELALEGEGRGRGTVFAELISGPWRHRQNTKFHMKIKL